MRDDLGSGAILLASEGAEAFWRDALRVMGIGLGVLLLAVIAIAIAQAIAKKAIEQFFIVIAAVLFAPIYFLVKAIVSKVRSRDEEQEKEKHLKEKKVKEEKRPNGRKGDHVKKPD